VPFVLVSESRSGASLRDGELADVAPTLCDLLGIEPGPEMTGRSLIARTGPGEPAHAQFGPHRSL
jgi:2,3-bisphosphoglycerate-independent phosphoglycerate mutase